jgi:hypothetical protein
VFGFEQKKKQQQQVKQGVYMAAHFRLAGK